MSCHEQLKTLPLPLPGRVDGRICSSFLGHLTSRIASPGSSVRSSGGLVVGRHHGSRPRPLTLPPLLVHSNPGCSHTSLTRIWTPRCCPIVDPHRACGGILYVLSGPLTGKSNMHPSLVKGKSCIGAVVFFVAEPLNQEVQAARTMYLHQLPPAMRLRGLQGLGLLCCRDVLTERTGGHVRARPALVCPRLKPISTTRQHLAAESTCQTD